ncbi:hypothetical protein ABMY26_33510 [Azospirillum sp. HJ39]|uniref:hypothetical protein n=1 Tax=Azospirillum sp. HJ39 TaxID=3159496 RepID=UPI00355847FC
MDIVEKFERYKHQGYVPDGSKQAWEAVLKAAEAVMAAVQAKQALERSGASDPVMNYTPSGAVGQTRSMPDVDGERLVHAKLSFELIRDFPAAAGEKTTAGAAANYIRARWNDANGVEKKLMHNTAVQASLGGLEELPGWKD